MNLISRISRIFVVYCALFALSGGADAFAADGFEIRTARGKVYRNCKVLKADPHGLSFRHSNGVAKIAFEDLDQSLQKKYNYKKEEAEEFIRAHDAPSAPALPAMIQPIPLPGFSASMAPMIQASLPYAYTYPPVYWGSGGAYYGSAGYGSAGYGNHGVRTTRHGDSDRRRASHGGRR